MVFGAVCSGEPSPMPTQSLPQGAPERSDVAPLIVDAVVVSNEAVQGALESATEQPSLRLDSLVVEMEQGSWGGARALTLQASVHVLRPVDRGTFVHVKGVCRGGAHAFADTGYLSQGHQPMFDHEPGSTLELQGVLFSSGLPDELGPCELTVTLGGALSGVVTPLGQACFEGGQTFDGPCQPALRRPTIESDRELSVEAIEVSKLDGIGGQRSLQVQYLLSVGKRQDRPSRIVVKATCLVDEERRVAVHANDLAIGPLGYEVGESLVQQATLFFDPSMPTTQSFTPCTLAFLWRRRGLSESPEPFESVLHRACYDGVSVEDGACRELAEPPPPTPVPLMLRNVDMRVVEPIGSRVPRFQLSLGVDVFAQEALPGATGLFARITCKVGRSAPTDTAYFRGVELDLLAPGETTRLRSMSFIGSPMETRPDSCEATFVVGERGLGSGSTAEVGKWCLQRNLVEPGGC